jgi:hypothetical protein
MSRFYLDMVWHKVIRDTAAVCIQPIMIADLLVAKFCLNGQPIAQKPERRSWADALRLARRGECRLLPPATRRLNTY